MEKTKQKHMSETSVIWGIRERERTHPVGKEEDYMFSSLLTYVHMLPPRKTTSAVISMEKRRIHDIGL